MTCTFCKLMGHNIRKCTDPAVGYALLQVRCKRWKSINCADLSVLWLWLHKQLIPTLRIILIHKYNTFPKTMSKVKLIAIIMNLEFSDAGEDVAFWRLHLPSEFTNTAVDVNNRQEKDLLLINIIEYNQPITNELSNMLNAELVDVLMPLYVNARDLRRAIRLSLIRKRIAYVVPDVKVDVNDVFECSICYEDVDGPKTVRLGCNHTFCCSCIETYIRGKEVAILCPLCRGEIMSVSMCVIGNESLMSVL
jgi:hypothetical protein